MNLNVFTQCSAHFVEIQKDPAEDTQNEQYQRYTNDGVEVGRFRPLHGSFSVLLSHGVIF
jgi:hypothetical protein